ncbi:MAG: transposase, partial [Anaerolineaceae bacterium]
RVFVEGGIYFFTLVTYKRRTLLGLESNIDLLKNAMEYVRKRHPFNTIAQVVLPDHLHAIWELPEGDSDYPTRWYLIKSHFSRNFNKQSGILTSLRMSKGERTVWQRRYWEHFIRNESDLDNHIDYIHYNPVHHQLVKTPSEWGHSTFFQHVQEGRYSEDWAMELNDNDWKTVRE